MSVLLRPAFRPSLTLLSLGTQQYKCFFNQGGVNADGQCAGPTSSVQGGISAAMPGGSFIGALASGILTDWLGRKRAIQWGAVIWCIGSIIVCSSFSIAQLVVGRFINGVAVGICSAQVPVYVSELAQPSKRGRVVGAQQWAITWGVCQPSRASTSNQLTVSTDSDYVLYFLRMQLSRRRQGMESPMGSSNASCHWPGIWPFLPSRVSTLVGKEGPLRRSS